MSVTVSEQPIVDALHQLSPDRWDVVLTFIESLRPAGEPEPENDKRPLTASDLLESGLVGLWSGRSDIGDSQEFARRLRRSGPNPEPRMTLLDTDVMIDILRDHHTQSRFV